MILSASRTAVRYAPSSVSIATRFVSHVAEVDLNAASRCPAFLSHASKSDSSREMRSRVPTRRSSKPTSAASRPSPLIFSTMSLGEIGSWRGSWLGAGLMGAKPMWSKARARSRVELDSARLDTSCCASSEALSSAENKTRRSTSTGGDRTGAWMNCTRDESLVSRFVPLGSVYFGLNFESSRPERRRTEHPASCHEDDRSRGPEHWVHPGAETQHPHLGHSA